MQAYSPLITHFLKFTSTTVGRDKVYRAVQYWSRFYAWYLLRKGARPDVIAPWAALKSHLGLARKLMRLGKPVEHAKAASVLAQSQAKTDPIIKYLAIARQLGYAGYLTYDAANWAHGAKFITLKNNKQISQTAAKFWFTGLSCNIIAGLYKLYLNNQAAARITTGDSEKSAEEKKLAKDKYAAQYQLLQDALDICNPGTSLGVFHFDDGFIGLAGLGSSLLGLNTYGCRLSRCELGANECRQWKKCAP